MIAELIPRIIWFTLRSEIKNRNYGFVETTMLGWVPFKVNEEGEYEGWVHPVLQYEANKHGLFIESALWKENKYVVRLLNQKDNK